MPNYYGADPAQEAAAQLQSIFQGLGLDDFGAQMFGSVDVIAGDEELHALAADVLANDYMYGAESPQTQAAKAQLVKRAATRIRRPMQRPAGSPAMQNLERLALARAAGKTAFDTTGEQNSAIKHERLPIPPTVITAHGTLAAPAGQIMTVRPTRSMQINRVAFPSLDVATANCVLLSITILGVEQLNGPGGIPCSLMTEVETAPNLKGSTAQAGQDITLNIGNTSAVDQTIRGAFSGPDIVRVT